MDLGARLGIDIFDLWLDDPVDPEPPGALEAEEIADWIGDLIENSHLEARMQELVEPFAQLLTETCQWKSAGVNHATPLVNLARAGNLLP